MSSDIATGISWGFIWDGHLVQPYKEQGSTTFFQCSWSASSGRYLDYRRRSPDLQPRRATPIMGFEIDINNIEKTSDLYRIFVSYREGHAADTSVTQYQHLHQATIDDLNIVNVDEAWHRRSSFLLPTGDLLPPKDNNPDGKYTFSISITREGHERNFKEAQTIKWKPFAIRDAKGGKWKFDKLEKPYFQCFIKLDILIEGVGTHLPSVPKTIPVNISSTIQARSAYRKYAVPKFEGESVGIPPPPVIQHDYKAVIEPTPSTVRSDRHLQYVDPDVKNMTSEEKDAEIMFLRSLLASIQTANNDRTPDISEKEKVKFERDLSRVGM
ncbi:hypothetical protein H072_8752 [Dactylellina haptotyla CBS 200.50]|uniref:Uncharacterized protein n=1 Tax=Dactylellina haptotyla (strain CBS 200.50) TaxID=1284197 RepID=S8A8W2_DACHA|nr:hypothetical protein H072_8752 [Dactylellina haptotyla CBS 200.50]